MNIKATVVATIDGDQLHRAMKIAEVRDAEWRIRFDMVLGNAHIEFETAEEVFRFLKAMAPSNGPEESRQSLAHRQEPSGASERIDEIAGPASSGSPEGKSGDSK